MKILGPIRAMPLFVLVTLTALFLGSCASAPKQHGLEIRVSASADVNPDLENRASPLILHILELTAIDEFNRADYFSLTQNDAAALGVDVLNKTEVILTPSSERVVQLELNENIAFLGFVAGYRDIDNSRWRLTQEVSPGKTDWIAVDLGSSQISIVEVND